MRLRNRVAVGCEAGALAGASVIAVFLFRDLLAVEPFSTPGALVGRWFGPGGYEMDLSLLATVTAVVGFGFRLVAYTLFHFTAFMCLGVLATSVLRSDGSWFASLAGGAAFGVSACSLAYYGGAFLAEGAATAGTPGVLEVLGANLVAGIVIGGFLHVAVMVQANGEAEIV